MATPRRKRRAPPELEDIGDAAMISQADVERAKEQWRKDAPEQYRYLLDARVLPDPEDAEP
jgi:hypothetical protein